MFIILTQIFTANFSKFTYNSPFAISMNLKLLRYKPCPILSRLLHGKIHLSQKKEIL